ncbi:MAG TPA: DedA family protein [Burkholderiaceae bacterium]|nr:DedA family protein [Burkholderiaceae bacterium]
MFDLAALDDLHALWLLAVTTLLHELGVPVPMSPAALFVGTRVAAGKLDPLLVMAAIVSTTLLGNAAWFAAGRRYGPRVLKIVSRLSRSAYAKRAQSATTFERWGSASLVIGRFVPGVALLAPPLAGALGMSWRKFVALTVIGSVLYSLAILGVGMVLHQHGEAAWAWLADFGWHALVVGAAAFAVYFAWRWRRPRLARTLVQATA